MPRAHSRTPDEGGRTRRRGRPPVDRHRSVLGATFPPSCGHGVSCSDASVPVVPGLDVVPPFVTVDAVRRMTVGLQEEHVEVRLCVANLNRYALSSRRVTSKLDVGGERQAVGSGERPVLPPPLSSTTVPSAVDVTPGAPMASIVLTGEITNRVHQPGSRRRFPRRCVRAPYSMRRPGAARRAARRHPTRDEQRQTQPLRKRRAPQAFPPAIPGATP